MEIFVTVFSAIIGLLGVWLGSHLTTKNSIKLQKQFMAKQLKIAKVQEITSDLLEYLRGVSIIHMTLVDHIKGNITLDEFRNINDNQQEKLLVLQRKFVVNQVFFSNFDENTEQINILFGEYTNRIYDGFQYPDGKNKIYNGEEVTYKAIEKKLVELSFVVDGIIKRLNIRLNQEIKDLE